MAIRAKNRNVFIEGLKGVPLKLLISKIWANDSSDCKIKTFVYTFEVLNVGLSYQN